MGVFEGRVALVTGGGTGIGQAAAMLLAERGCHVVVAGRREAPLIETAKTNPERISYAVMDLADARQHDTTLETVIARHGRLDILVNNAALSNHGPFADLPPETFATTVHVNLISTALLMQKALPHLAATKGNIVNISSAIARFNGMPAGLMSAYAASKAGLNQLTRTLALELGPQGIRVNAVAPGMTESEMTGGFLGDPAAMDYIVAITPLGRIGLGIDIAKVICFLASDEAAWVTGQVVDAAGGFWLSC